MKKIEAKILYFLIITVFGLILVAIFNYTVDSRKFFHPQNGVMITLNIFDKELPFFIKRYKDFKSENLIIGLSEAEFLFSKWIITEKFSNFIIVSNDNYQTIYKCIKHYVETHKETKKIIFVLPISSFYTIQPDRKDEYEISKIKFLSKMLLSIDITKSNIYFLINKIFLYLSNKKICKINYPYSRTNFYNPFIKFIDYYKAFVYNQSDFFNPFVMLPDYAKRKNQVDKDNMQKFKYLEKCINFLKEKNIDVAFVIPPENTIQLVNIKFHNYYSILDKIKRFAVEKSDNVYDFSIINRLTSINSFSEYNYWFQFPDHPGNNFAYKILISLFYENDSDDSIYVKLTKDNIDKQLKKQEERLNQFITENKRYIDTYIENCSDDKYDYFCHRDIANIPFELIKDKIFIHKKFDEKNHEIIFNSLFFLNISGLRAEKPFSHSIKTRKI